MKLPEPVAWMLDGKPYIAQQCRLFSMNPGEVIPGQVPLFTEAQLREALAQQAEELKQLQEQNTALDAKLAQQEAVMRQALDALEKWSEADYPDSRSEAFWAGEAAIKALEGQLK